MRVTDLKDFRPKLLSARLSFEPTISPIAILFERRIRGNSAALKQKDISILHLENESDFEIQSAISTFHHMIQYAAHAVVPKQRYRVRRPFILVWRPPQLTGFHPSVPVESFVICPSVRLNYRLWNGRNFLFAVAKSFLWAFSSFIMFAS